MARAMSIAIVQRRIRVVGGRKGLILILKGFLARSMIALILFITSALSVLTVWDPVRERFMVLVVSLILASSLM